MSAGPTGRRKTAAFVTVLAASLCAAAHAAGEAVPAPEYAKLVARYQSGDRAGATSALAGWSEARLDSELKRLEKAARRAAKCTRCPERLVFERFSLRAALLLHADAEAQQTLPPPVSEQPPPSCGTGPQARVVERLADLLLLVDPTAGDFLLRFYLGTARQAHWSHCLGTAQYWARAGLRRFPKDSLLLLTLGIAAENDAFHLRAPTAHSAGISSKQRSLWEEAQRIFEDALAAEPVLHEARLRLGRVLWRLGNAEAARGCFEAVLSADADASLHYLAHLFLGRLHQEAGRFPEAEKECAAALRMRPASEPAAVAVSYLRQLQGDTEGAREVLNRFLVFAHRRSELDPYIGYLMAHASTGERILDRLRAENAG